MFDHVWRHARLANPTPDGGDIAITERGAVACRDGRIAWVGPENELPRHEAPETDCEGRLLTPGLIDCHTHLVHAGNRAGEWERRLAGESYERIAQGGGGIAATVRATRAASEAELERQSLARLDRMLAGGVTTVEIKSGYGLERESEARQLRVARRLSTLRPVRVSTSFLGAHAVPPGGNADRHIDAVVNEMLPAIAREGLADAVDGFAETIAFTPEQIARVFAAARAYGLPVRLHADQLSAGGGAQLAAEWGALSADHLERTDEDGVVALARSGTVAVLLPGAYYFMRDTHVPPVEAFRRHGVPMAVATDCNPGTSPLTSLTLAMNLAATLFRLTVAECLAGATRHAARALGLAEETGALEPGLSCDLAIWDAEAPAELVYRIGETAPHRRVWRGT